MADRTIEETRFLSHAEVRRLAERFGTPVYVYDEARLTEAAQRVLQFPHAFGLTARYAMKALPNGHVLRLFDRLGLHFDASSGFEVERALKAGIAADKIALTAQELPANFSELHAVGMRFNACSLEQVRLFAERFPGQALGVRFNPGLGSGGTKRTNVGGPAASFGIWHEDRATVQEIAAAHGLTVERIHTHIGSGSDPAVWQKVAGMSLRLLEHFPDAHTLNLGGGYKVGRMRDEASTDLQDVGRPVVEAFVAFGEATGRRIRLEVEPGTYLVANAGCVIATVHDRTSTGGDGYRFLKIDSGMTEMLRPSMYGAQHPLVSVAATGNDRQTPDRIIDAVVAGHCCESGDILTPATGDPEALAPRPLRDVGVGDYLVIEGAGAYCAGMSAKHYNSFPEAPEVLYRGHDREPLLIRKRQTLDQIIQNETVG